LGRSPYRPPPLSFFVFREWLSGLHAFLFPARIWFYGLDGGVCTSPYDAFDPPETNGRHGSLPGKHLQIDPSPKSASAPLSYFRSGGEEAFPSSSLFTVKCGSLLFGWLERFGLTPFLAPNHLGIDGGLPSLSLREDVQVPLFPPASLTRRFVPCVSGTAVGAPHRRELSLPPSAHSYEAYHCCAGVFGPLVPEPRNFAGCISFSLTK